jgi:hypothetical protein
MEEKNYFLLQTPPEWPWKTLRLQYYQYRGMALTTHLHLGVHGLLQQCIYIPAIMLSAPCLYAALSNANLSEFH